MQEQCDRLGLDAEVVHGPVEGTYRLVRTVPADMPITVVVPTRAEGGATRPYRLAGGRDDQPRCARRIRRPDWSSPIPRPSPQNWLHCSTRPLVTVGNCCQSAAIGRSPQRSIGRSTHYPCEVLVSVAPGLVPRSDVTPDWLETLAGLARSPGTGSGRFDDRR